MFRTSAKYGLRDETVTARALAAIDELNRGFVLAEAFEGQSEEIKAILRSAPTPLSRRPRQPRNVTFHDLPPTITDLVDAPAAADRGRARFGVSGMTYLPDPANQVVSIAAQHPKPPRGEPPRTGDGLWTLTDLIALQGDMMRLCR